MMPKSILGIIIGSSLTLALGASTFYVYRTSEPPLNSPDDIVIEITSTSTLYASKFVIHDFPTQFPKQATCFKVKTNDGGAEAFVTFSADGILVGAACK